MYMSNSSIKLLQKQEKRTENCRETHESKILLMGFNILLSLSNKTKRQKITKIQ